MTEETKPKTIETILGETINVVKFYKHGNDEFHYAMTREGIYRRSNKEEDKYEVFYK